MKNSPSFLRPWAARVALAVIVLAVLAMVLAPVFIIMPFKAQTQGGTENALSNKKM